MFHAYSCLEILVRLLGEKHVLINWRVTTLTIPSDKSVISPGGGSLCNLLYPVFTKFVDVTGISSYILIVV